MKYVMSGKDRLMKLSGLFVVFTLVLLSAPDRIRAGVLEGTIKIGGTGGAIGAMKELAAAFQKKHPSVRIDIISHLGTRGGINAVLEGAIDIGLAGRHLGPEELSMGLKEVEYAKSPFVFVTAESGKGKNLTLEMIVRIYRGDIRKWPDGTPIRLILRTDGDVDTIMLKGISHDMREAVEKAEAREGMTIAMDDQENSDLVEKLKGSFGTSTLTQIISEKRAFTVLPLNGITPDIGAMVAGSYPYYKIFVMVMGPKSSPISRDFVAFVRSPEGKRILTRTGNYVTQGR